MMDHLPAALVRVVRLAVAFDSNLSPTAIHAPAQPDGLRVHLPIPKSRAFVRVVGKLPFAAFDLDSPAAALHELADQGLPRPELPRMKAELKLTQPVSFRTCRKSGVALYFQIRTLDIAMS